MKTIRIKYRNRIYTRYPESAYHSSRDYYIHQKAGHTPIMLHRVIYEDHFGPIPYEHVIHHIDFNPDNNHPDNLMAVTTSQHARFHHDDPEFGERWRQSVATGVRKAFADAPTIHKVCPWCGIGFETSTYTPATYCCAACADKAYATLRETRVCVICGKAFDAHPTQSQAVTCSPSCSMKLQQRDTERVCRHCGKTFTTKHIDPDRVLYCSTSCWRKATRSKRMETRICCMCGNEFTTDKYKNARTCSNECRIARIRKFGQHLRFLEMLDAMEARQ